MKKLIFLFALIILTPYLQAQTFKVKTTFPNGVTKSFDHQAYLVNKSFEGKQDLSFQLSLDFSKKEGVKIHVKGLPNQDVVKFNPPFFFVKQMKNGEEISIEIKEKSHE